MQAATPARSVLQPATAGAGAHFARPSYADGLPGFFDLETSRAARPDRAGLPGPLRAGIESLSGMEMSGVRVHENSPRPAQIDALAFAEGDDIHLAPGQQRYLPHEAWHVVQQRQGRVTATAERVGVRVNDDEGLEREADAMGARALSLGHVASDSRGSPAGARADGGNADSVPARLPGESGLLPRTSAVHAPVVQGVFTPLDIEHIQGMPSDQRVNLLAAVSEEDWRQFRESGFYEKEDGSIWERLGELQEIDRRRHSLVFGLAPPATAPDDDAMDDDAMDIDVTPPQPEPVVPPNPRKRKNDVLEGGFRPPPSLPPSKRRKGPVSVPFLAELDGEFHTLSADPKTSAVIVRSDPTPLADITKKWTWLNHAIPPAQQPPLQQAETDVQAALKKVQKNPSNANNSALAAEMRTVAGILGNLTPTPIPDTDLSKSDYFNVNTPQTVGTKVVADPLSPHSSTAGSTAKDGALMTALRQKVAAAGGKSKDPVQAHLLNMKTWGPGELWNLTPASKKFNSDQEKLVETPLKRALYEKGIVMKFEARVSYNNPPPLGADYTTNPEKYLFTQIQFIAEQLHDNGANWAPDKKKPTDPDVKAVNRKMNWDQGNFPQLQLRPNVHTEQQAAPFKNVGLPPSVVYALTTYNAKVMVGNPIPGTTDIRKRWPANVALGTFAKDLDRWLATKPTLAPGPYSGPKKVKRTGFPTNWKKLLDFT